MSTMSTAIICQLPNDTLSLYRRQAVSSFFRTIMPAHRESDARTVRPKAPEEMSIRVTSDTKNTVAQAVVTSVRALTDAIVSADIPASINVESVPIPNGDGSRLSIHLDTPSPVSGTDTFVRLHGAMPGNWELLDFSEFNRAWMSKRFLPVDTAYNSAHAV